MGSKFCTVFLVSTSNSQVHTRERGVVLFHGILSLNWPTDKGSYGHVRGAR
jgi:hypothetical protein